MAGSDGALPPLTLGTAGHVDHGKTALIGALTGKHTDRLEEERRRGISIELGYAPLQLPSGRSLSVVDAPGHERFVRTMVAGATGIDMYLACVAADDGVMPQTREHLAVLRQLGVSAGVVAITKADVGDPEPAAEGVAEVAPGAEVVPVSALARTGVDELLAALDRVAARLPGRAATDGQVDTRLHVDRSFTLKGIGTVVTGTLWSGRIVGGEEVRVLPRGLRARVRSVQVHDRQVEAAEAGQRVALNLAGLGWRELGRGDVIVAPSAGLAPTYLIDCRIALEQGAEPLRGSVRLHVHHGTRESPARLVPLEGYELSPQATAYAQLRLEAPLIAARGDRVVLRRLAPPDTIGGGEVIHPSPRKHPAGPEVVEWLRAVERGEDRPDPRERDAAGRTSGRRSAAAMCSSPPPLDDAALRMAAILRSDGREPRTDADLAATVEVDPAAAADRLRRLERAGQVVRAGQNLHFHPEPLAELEARVVAICKRDGEATIAGIRDELATSRKYAQAVLEHLDATKVTRRRGDAHVLRRS
ncbi:MAG: selenocysteine-specific translation elongation factor [Thermoleophilaceae bacterium]